MTLLQLYMLSILIVLIGEFVENRKDELFTLPDLMKLLFTLLIAPIVIILWTADVVDNYLLQNGIDIRDIIIWRRKDDE